MKNVCRTIAVGIVATIGIGVAATPSGASPYTAALCAQSIVTVLDAEANNDRSTIDATVPQMSRRCLRIGGKAEADRDAGFAVSEVVERMLTRIAKRYHVTRDELTFAYNDL